MSRIVCAWIARFELALHARRNPALWRRPIAVADVALPQAALLTLTPAAEALGLREGMRVTQALALASTLELLAPSQELRRAAEEEVLAVLGTLSPALDADGLGAF
jgi:nucleotidyltransferase/DNA polymerase involved in DNA repair